MNSVLCLSVYIRVSVPWFVFQFSGSCFSSVVRVWVLWFVSQFRGLCVSSVVCVSLPWFVCSVVCVWVPCFVSQLRGLCLSFVVCVSVPCFVSQFHGLCLSSVFCLSVLWFVLQFVRSHTVCIHGFVQNHQGGILQYYEKFLWDCFFGNDLTFPWPLPHVDSPKITSLCLDHPSHSPQPK